MVCEFDVYWLMLEDCFFLFLFWMCDVIIVCFWRGGRRGVGRREEVEVGEPLEFGLRVSEGFSWQAQRWWWSKLGILDWGRDTLNLFGRFWIVVHFY